MEAGTNHESAFAEHRELLFSIAYRMLGSVADAEDMVQETFLRWQRADQNAVSPRAFLVTIVSRLCINHLKSARRQRELYVGEWLPEPIVTDIESDPAESISLDESLSIALMLVLEQLTPLERAVFLLHDVFAFKCKEIGQSLNKTETHCRQVLSRARKSLASKRHRFEVATQEHHAILDRFFAASRGGDMNALIDLLSQDVTLHLDADRSTPVPEIISGRDKVARGLSSGGKRLPSSLIVRKALVNNQVALVCFNDDRPFSVLVLDISDGKIVAVYILTNADKLAHLSRLA